MCFVMQKALALWKRIMHNGGMRSHSDIIRGVGAQAISDLTETSINTVRSWGQRDSIPSEYWAKLIGAGHATADELIDAAAAKRAA
jgi:hypothetical protein